MRGQGGSRETVHGAIAVIQAIDAGGLDSDDNSEDGESAQSTYVLKVEPWNLLVD